MRRSEWREQEGRNIMKRRRGGVVEEHRGSTLGNRALSRRVASDTEDIGKLISAAIETATAASCRECEVRLTPIGEVAIAAVTHWLTWTDREMRIVGSSKRANETISKRD